MYNVVELGGAVGSWCLVPGEKLQIWESAFEKCTDWRFNLDHEPRTFLRSTAPASCPEFNLQYGVKSSFWHPCLCSCSTPMPKMCNFQKRPGNKRVRSFIQPHRMTTLWGSLPAIVFSEPHWRNTSVGQRLAKSPCGVIRQPQGTTPWDLEDDEWQWQLR